MEWYYSNSGVQSGPVSIEELRAKLASGEVSGADLVWRDGMTDWMPASVVAELASGVRSMPAVPGSATYPMAPETPGMAVASLICGLVGLVGFFACWVPGLAGIGGIICGHKALRMMKGNEARYTGKGLAIGGLVTGYLATFFVLIVSIFLAVVMLWSKELKTDSNTEMRAFEESITIQESQDAVEDSPDAQPGEAGE